MKIDPRLKILYILAVSVPVFIWDDWRIVGGLLGLQVVLWFAAGISLRKLRAFKKILRFAFWVIFFYALFHGGEEKTDLFKVFGWTCSLSHEGLEIGGMMIAKIFTMLSATFVVRFSSTSSEFVAGLRGFGLSESFALILDSILAEVEKSKGKKRKGSNKGKKSKDQKQKEPLSLRSLLRGDLKPITDQINQRLEEGREKFQKHDLVIISAFSVIVSLIRMIKITPGLPIAPGHKNVLIVPFLILTARMTRRPYGATSVGFISGVIQFLSGFGKYGPFNILQFMVPGLLIDLLVGLTFKANNIFIYGLIGLLAGAARVAAEIALALLIRVPEEFFVIYAPLIFSQCLFGAASAPITKYLVKHIKLEESKD